eukprot:gb/GECH01005802.1/.p1 GENE.gb/GECH01005802.1/~~gb/GECH01005802.1/.p1  ORF type:complete len:251 (+),score=23.26 gb/GECH01005802.1/:1-753(+)
MLSTKLLKEIFQQKDIRYQHWDEEDQVALQMWNAGEWLALTWEEKNEAITTEENLHQVDVVVVSALGSATPEELQEIDISTFTDSLQRDIRKEIRSRKKRVDVFSFSECDLDDSDVHSLTRSHYHHACIDVNGRRFSCAIQTCMPFQQILDEHYRVKRELFSTSVLLSDHKNSSRVKDRCIQFLEEKLLELHPTSNCCPICKERKPPGPIQCSNQHKDEKLCTVCGVEMNRHSEGDLSCPICRKKIELPF